MRKRDAAWSAVVVAIGFVTGAHCRQAFAVEQAASAGGGRSPISQFDVVPTRIVWQSAKGVGSPESLLARQAPQPLLASPIPPCTLTASDDGPAGVLLDFGRELQGHVELFTPLAPTKDPVRVRVRFGESASEAMADLGDRNAQNDHAIRDSVVTLPWLGTQSVGPSGFRFVRIDAVDPGKTVMLSQVRAKLGVRDLPRIGSFRSSDPRLDRVWEVGADTVHLCMQDYLWDGIKRDRLVWIGDMHPEFRSIEAVFGHDDVVPESLDLTRDATPVTEWMNGISSYSMWWVLIHEELWMHRGDRAYLEAQRPYLTKLLERLAALVGADGRERIDGLRFLDWPSSPNQEGVTAGLQGLLVMTLDAGARLMDELGDDSLAALCREAANRGRKVVPDVNGSKSGAALLALAGMRDAKETAKNTLLPGGAAGVSTFYGVYVLEALAEAGEIDAALDLIRVYWGGMLDLGATTLWEDFELAWTENAGRIDELVPPGKKDIHGDCGAYCYEGFRHSLCHGWASGPTSFLSRRVLGVTVAAPGMTKLRVAPRLGKLQWAEGTYPTPRGPLFVRHEKRADGSVGTTIRAPEGIEIEGPPGAAIESVVAVASPQSSGERYGGLTPPADGLLPQGLLCEWLTDPAGIDARAPRLSWRYEGGPNSRRGLRQTKYQILAASAPGLLEPGKADRWDSGVVASSETLSIVWGGKPLVSGERVHWTVRVWDEAGVPSRFAPPATFLIGQLEANDWKGEWISTPDHSAVHADPATLHLPPARRYRKVVGFPKPVKRGVLHGTALGLVDWRINGQPVSDAWFAPGWADYAQRVHTRSHDVTALLGKEPGAACLAAEVADGWYAGYLGYGLLVGYGPHRTGRNFYGTTPALMGQLDVEYADGTRESFVTDTSWEVSSAGPTREADFLMGERHDARQAQAGWDTPGFEPEPHQWQRAIAAAALPTETVPFFESGVEREAAIGFAKPPRLVASTAPPIRVVGELPARSVREVQPGVFVFDFGQNFAGVVRLSVEAPEGTAIRLRHGEMLHADGTLMTENLRRARAVDTYVCRGGGRETWQPRFTYHGFQYVEVSGLPEGMTPLPSLLVGLVLSNDMPPTGSFACSDPVMTKFWENTTWTQRANFIEVPTDCPQRDERFGWMGDAQIYARTATFNADVAAFFTKWLDDVEEAQIRHGKAAGAYPDYCPYPMAHGAPGAVHGTAWTDAGVICPWTMWRVYGDSRLVERHWASMERFMAWRLAADPKLEGVNLGNTWGDWLNVQEETPIEYVDLCYHAQSARMMAEMAEALGRGDAEAGYRRRLADLAASFRRKYLLPSGLVSVATQSACVLALEAGVVPEDRIPVVTGQLVGRIAANDTRMATGFLGTKAILPVLSAHGQHDLACRLFQSRKFPSWGYEVEQGANTVWERWDSYTKEHGFNGATGSNNAAMNSFSHYAFGAVMEWGFRTLAGIDVGEPGGATVHLHPRLPSRDSNPDLPAIDWVKADWRSPRGTVRSHARRVGDRLEVSVTIPPNTVGRLVVTAKGPEDVTEGGRAMALVPGVRVMETTDAGVVLALESGNYVFAVGGR